MADIKSINVPDESLLYNEVKETNKSIIVAGEIGVGKTYLLDKMFDYNKNELMMVNGTLTSDELIILLDFKLYDLFNVCLIIKRILDNVKKHHLALYLEHFSRFENYVDNIITRINAIYITGLYKNAQNIVNDQLYDCPEILLEDFLSFLMEKLDIKTVYLLVDSFDKVGDSSALYQKLIYEKLRKYMTVIMAISDSDIVNDDNKLEKFKSSNEVIKLEYSKNVNVVAEILDEEIFKYYQRRRISDKAFKIKDILSDEVILIMIEKTNGNLFDLFSVIRALCDKKSKLLENEYESFVLNYIDNEINVSPVISGRIIPKRTLYIKP